MQTDTPHACDGQLPRCSLLPRRCCLAAAASPLLPHCCSSPLLPHCCRPTAAPLRLSLRAIPSGRTPQNAAMAQINLEMADVTGVDMTNADLTEAYLTGAIVNGPKGALTKIDNTDWTDAQLYAPRCLLEPPSSSCSCSAPLVSKAGSVRAMHACPTFLSHNSWRPYPLLPHRFEACVTRAQAQRPAHLLVHDRKGREPHDGSGDEDEPHVQGLMDSRSIGSGRGPSLRWPLNSNRRTPYKVDTVPVP